MSLKKVGIIGANGFIGTQLTNLLIAQSNLELNIFGRASTSKFTGNFNYNQLDLSNSQQIEDYLKHFDIVYYLASDSIPSSSWDNPIFEINNNLTPFLTFMEAIGKTAIKKVVFVSSAGTIYGRSLSKLTEDSDKKPFSPYGITKLAMENFLNYYEVKSQIMYDVFRVSNVYGIGQDTSKGLGIINTFLEKILAEKKVLIFGDGNNIRNYINVKDVAKLLSISVSSDLSQSNVYNLASNDNLSINEIVATIKDVVKEEFSIEYKAVRQSDNPAISLDNSKILNQKPGFDFIPIHTGIKEIYNHLKVN